MWADPYDLAGLGLGATAATYSSGEEIPAEQQAQAQQIMASRTASEAAVAVQPSTETQIFNLVNTVAKGLLDVQQTNAQTKLSTAQIAALAEASKVQAQNYVMQQLQQGKQVMVPQSWLEKYSTSGTLTKWLTPILIAGGVGLLGYVLWKKYAARSVAANPRRRKKSRRR
jgi:hypothetical protein